MTYLFRKRRRSNDPILILLRNYIYRCNLSSSIREIIIKVFIIKKLLSFFISFHRQENTLAFLIVFQFKFSLRKYLQYTYIIYYIVNIIYSITILNNYVPLKLFNHKTVDFMLTIR